MNPYELAIILEGNITPAKKKKALASLEKLIKVLEGKILTVNEWGAKELAYSIKKNSTGFFVILTLELTPAAAKELPAKLKLEESILRYLLIRGEEK